MTPILVPPSGPWDARLLLVGEAPGADEVRLGQPFVGPAGQELDRMLSEAGISRGECFVTNLARERPPTYWVKGKPVNNDIGQWLPRTKVAQEARRREGWHHQLHGRVVAPQIATGFDLLRQEIDRVKPNLILALGNAPMWALTGKGGGFEKRNGISEWRGSEMETWFEPRVKVIPTFHPPYILRSWSDRSTAVADLQRARREMAYPERREPSYKLRLAPEYSETIDLLDALLIRALILRSAHGDKVPLYLVADIETIPAQGAITCLGIAWSSTEALTIPFWNGFHHHWAAEEEFQIVRLLRDLLTHPQVRVIGQNFLYDAQYISRQWGFTPNLWCDTMLSQHVCFPGQPKNLGFLASLHCEHYTYWKGMVRDHAKKDD